MSAPTPTVIVESISTTVKVRLSVEDMPVRTKAYGKRQYRPDRILISYYRRDEGDWKTQNVEVSGPYVLKDGTDGADRNADSLWNVQQYANYGVASLIEQFRPAS